jgi:hypothetical protein
MVVTNAAAAGHTVPLGEAKGMGEWWFVDPLVEFLWKMGSS